jgi:succinate-acetate transporter protein
MTIGALRTSVAVLWVFATLTATYLLLVLAELGVATSNLLPLAGYVGITCGVVAWYVAFAHVGTATFGREVIPTWPLSR